MKNYYLEVIRVARNIELRCDAYVSCNDKCFVSIRNRKTGKSKRLMETIDRDEAVAYFYHLRDTMIWW
ncbi:hypothetical protein [Otariodibacter oris]|uniref:hypothetical protein n=1 Tax=Otariodibacter oris TaxID=1032623 RepID=UPI000EB067DD|nr:hypothetical protein [Otariodibacter oris]QGM80682.1 hypothetical protein A6A10_04320 [Otariodibacter oris]